LVAFDESSLLAMSKGKMGKGSPVSLFTRGKSRELFLIFSVYILCVSIKPLTPKLLLLCTGGVLDLIGGKLKE